MDVVKKYRKLRGKVDIHSVLGQGTTFTIKLPTLAVIDGMTFVWDRRNSSYPPYRSSKPASDSGQIKSVQEREHILNLGAIIHFGIPE